MKTPHSSHRFPSLALFLAAFAALQPAAAEDGDYERCRALESDAERLACYDALSKSETPAEAAPRPVTDAAPAKKENQPTTYTAVVTAMTQRPYGQAVVELDNGEVWSEQQASHAFLVNVGDTVTLKKSKFSSGYKLIAPGGRGYRVTRLE